MVLISFVKLTFGKSLQAARYLLRFFPGTRQHFFFTDYLKFDNEFGTLRIKKNTRHTP